MFYDNFIKLCNSIGKSPSAVAEDIGIEKSTVSRWKKGANPTDATVEKVASYFGISSAAVIGAAAFGGIPGLIAGAATGAIVSGAMGSGKSSKISDTLQSLDPGSSETDFSPDKKEPAPISRDGLSPAKRQLLEAVDDLTDEQCEKLLGIVREAKRLL